MRKLLASAVMVAALVACQCQDPPLAADSAEPNDTPAAAAALVGVFSGTMNERDTPDFFKFSANTNQTVTLQLTEGGTKGSSFMDLRVNVVAPNGATVLARDRVFQGTPAPLQFTAPTAGDYLLKLEGFYVGPVDAFCIVGRLRYQLSATLSGP